MPEDMEKCFVANNEISNDVLKLDLKSLELACVVSQCPHICGCDYGCCL